MNTPKRPKLMELLAILRDAKRSARCICGNPKKTPDVICKRCAGRVSSLAKSGVRSTIEANQAEGYFDAVKNLEGACILREGATAALFGGGQ